MISGQPNKKAGTKPIVNPHAGHRDRLKRQFLDAGLDGFRDHQILELLLFYAIPLRDTNPLAHALLDRFGSLHAVLRAPMNVLTSVSGIGQHTAALMRDFCDFAAGALEEPTIGKTHYDSYSAVGDFLLRFYRDRQNELVTLMLLNNSYELISFEVVGACSVHSAQLSPDDLVKRALDAHAAMAVVAHNHPGRLAVPTEDDASTTRLLRDSFALVNITLLEHYLVSDTRYIGLNNTRRGQVRQESDDRFYTCEALPDTAFRAGELLSESTPGYTGITAEETPDGQMRTVTETGRQLLCRLLSYALTPESRVAAAADALETSFGGLQMICAATPEQLETAGLSLHAAVLLRLALPAYGAACMRIDAVSPLRDARQIGTMFVHRYIGKINETVYLLLLDSRMNKIDVVCAGEGAVNSAHFSVRRVAELAYFRGAMYAVLSHNHPFGTATPSTADLNTTFALKQALAMVGCTLLEHFIVAGGRYAPVLLLTDRLEHARCRLPDFYDTEMLKAAGVNS